MQPSPATPPPLLLVSARVLAGSASVARGGIGSGEGLQGSEDSRSEPSSSSSLRSPLQCLPVFAAIRSRFCTDSGGGAKKNFGRLLLQKDQLELV